MFGKKKKKATHCGEARSMGAAPGSSAELVQPNLGEVLAREALVDKQREVDRLRAEIAGLHRAIFSLRKFAPVELMSEEAQRAYGDATADLLMLAHQHLASYGYELNQLPPLGWGRAASTADAS